MSRKENIFVLVENSYIYIYKPIYNNKITYKGTNVAIIMQMTIQFIIQFLHD